MSSFAKHLLFLSPVALLLAACETSSGIKGLPKDLPVINLHGSSSTPGHSMSRADYPFNPDGGYNTAWAAEGAASRAIAANRAWRRRMAAHTNERERPAAAPTDCVDGVKIALRIASHTT